MASPARTETRSPGDEPVTYDVSKGVKHLVEAFPNLRVIPPANVLPVSTLSEAVAQVSVPVIDLYDLDDSDGRRGLIVQAIASACADWGFFCIINHGIDDSIMDEMLCTVEAFFALPLEVKQSHSSDDVMCPVMYGTNLNMSFGPHACHWRDYLRHFGHPIHKSSFHLWPTNPPNYRDVAKVYLEEVWRVAMRLAGAISESLGLERDYVERAFGEGSQIVACNYYPPCPQPYLTLGLSGHTDRGGITILMQNEVEGLQVKHKGEWVPVPHMPGSFMVNLGDCLEILTNGRYKSVEHRAVVNQKKARISVAVGNGPGHDDIIEPAGPLVDPNSNGPKYGPMVFKELRFKDYMGNQNSSDSNSKIALEAITKDS